MTKQSLLWITVLVMVAVFGACKKDKEKPPLTVSRLYISNADIDTGLANITVYDPADKDPFPAPYNFKSRLPDANGILFDPFSGTVFQVGRQNKNIKTFSVSIDGKLTARNSFTDSGLVSAREIAFDRINNLLYVSSNTDSTIYVYSNVSSLNRAVTATKKLKLNGQPWGIHLNNDSLMVVIDQDRKEVQLYIDASTLVSGLINPAQKLIINGATRLHGITYSAKQDLLFITDIGLEDGSTSNADGSIYVVEEAKAKFSSHATISPNRTITGANTGLGNPVDTGLDEREGKNLIYVAEKANKKILVFHLADNGDVAPAFGQTLITSPEAIYIDAR